MAIIIPTITPLLTMYCKTVGKEAKMDWGKYTTAEAMVSEMPMIVTRRCSRGCSNNDIMPNPSSWVNEANIAAFATGPAARKEANMLQE